MIIALKIGACFCCLIGLLVGAFLAERVSSLDDYYVVSKSVRHDSTWREYRILAKQADVYGKLDGLGVENSYSKSFYELAVPGDRLRTSLLYSQLIHNGRVIKRDVSGDFILLALPGLLAFLTLIVFIRFKNTLPKVIAYSIAGATEFLTVWLFLYLYFWDD